MQKKPICISFIPSSREYQKYPYGITVISITNCNLERMLLNIRDRVYTHGIIVAEGYKNDLYNDIENLWGSRKLPLQHLTKRWLPPGTEKWKIL